MRVNPEHHQHHQDKAQNSGTVPPIPGRLATMNITGTRPKIQGLSRPFRDGWQLCYRHSSRTFYLSTCVLAQGVKHVTPIDTVLEHSIAAHGVLAQGVKHDTPIDAVLEHSISAHGVLAQGVKHDTPIDAVLDRTFYLSTCVLAQGVKHVTPIDIVLEHSITAHGVLAQGVKHFTPIDTVLEHSISAHGVLAQGV